MIIKLEQDLSRKDIEVLIKYATMNKDVKRISMLLQSADTHIKCAVEGYERLVNAADIYYNKQVLYFKCQCTGRDQRVFI